MVNDLEETFPTGKRGFHIAHINVQSINNKLDLVKFHVKQMGFHVFSISETWLTEVMPDSFLNISEYNLVRWDRKWCEIGSNVVKRGGGVALYIKEELTFSQQGLGQYNVSNKNIECLWIKILRENAKDIIVGIVYRPPGGNVEMFCDYLKNTMEEIGNNFNKEIFILGDFNLNYLNTNDPNVKHLLDFEQLNGLKQLIANPTRGLNCIDLLFSNSNDIATAGVYPINISDHDMIFVTKKKAYNKRKKVRFVGRSYRNYNRDILQTQLRNAPWEEYWQLRDPNQCWSFILKTIETVLCVLCPLRTRNVRSSYEPWMNNGILEAIYDKDQAWRHAKISRDPRDINRAKQLRNEVKDKIRRAKRDFIQDELDNDLGSSKRFWEKINHILPTRENGNSISLIDQEKGMPLDDTEIPNYINTFFTNIGPNLAEKFTDAWDDVLPPFEGEKLGNVQVTEQMLEKVVKDINVNKASSITNISATVLKDAFLALIPQLTFMYNLSFETGIFPEEWKVANVIPLRKGGDPTDVGNLRPISLLPLPGKIAERIMHSHLSNFIENRGLLNNKQGGFRKGKSTISTVATLTDDILMGLNDKKFSIAAFIDLKKAFDTINHDILLKKLPHFGLNGNLITWIANYLTNRVQRCTVNGLTSETRPIAYFGASAISTVHQ